LEKQSTNVAQYSNDLSTAPSVVDASTTTANVYVSPDGTQNAMRFTETTANDRHGFYQYTTVTAQTYTASIFTKQTGRRYIAFNSDMINGVVVASFFDLQTISVVSSGSGHTCSIQDFGNGWLRLIVTYTVLSSASRYVIWGGSLNGTITSYAGSTSISQTFYGYQLEASSYPTSYIPTTSASATRVADACSKTGISSLIGQTEGTLFADFQFLSGTSGDAIIIRNSAYSTFIYINQQTSGNIFGQIQPAGIAFSTSATNGRLKCAVAYKSGDSAFFVNGVQVGTTSTTTFSITTMDIFQFLDPQLNVINEAVLFKTRLTNAELASLTTL
jgi:hypothetical protein